MVGTESDWLRVAELPVVSGRILFVDVSFVPHEEEGLTVLLEPTVYCVEAKVVDYGADRRVGRLRILAPNAGRPVGGARLGRTWTDTGKTGVCDLVVFGEAWGPDEDVSYRRIAPTVEAPTPFGVAVLNESTGAVMPFVESGFGDGEYPVQELLNATDRRRIGAEVVFIRQGRNYPF